MEPREQEDRYALAPKAGKLVAITVFVSIMILLFGAALYVLIQFGGLAPAQTLLFLIGGAAAFAVVIGLYLTVSLAPYRALSKNLGRYIDNAKSLGERYRLALQGASEGFWDYDVVKGQVYFSTRWMGMAGFGEKEQTSDLKFWQDHFHPEDREGIMRAITAHLDRRTPAFSVQYRLQRATGEYMWVEDSGRAMWDEKGKPLRMAGVTKDISNIKRVQEVLESRTAELEGAQAKIVAEIRNVEKFQKAVDSSTQAVVITDPTGAIVYVNPAWEQLNGYTAQEAMGRSLRILKSERTPPETYQALWEKIQAGVPFHSEDIINKRKSGAEYHADVSIFPIRDDGKNVFFVALSEDITQRKEVDRAKTEFVSLASHQLRTPLSAIRWYSEMLLSKYVGELNEKQLQYVKEIYAGNLRMVELVNALLNVSRLDLGTFAIEPEPTNLFEICDSLLGELTPQITEKQMVVNRVYDPQLPLYNGDPKLLRIILQNFLTNSVKYTQPGGQIEVEIALRDQNLYIKVADNGYGIPKHQQVKIFEKLFRADNVRQKDTEGTGLGMYIVKAIVEESGGKISFESEENKGTTFHVFLPIQGMPKKTGTKGLS